MAEAERLDEKRKTGISYIAQFNYNVEVLSLYYSQYINLMLEYKKKYGEDISKISEDDEKVFSTAVQRCREIVVRTYIQYKSITSPLKIKGTDSDKIRDCYDKIKKNFVISTDDLEEFTQSMNKVLINDVIQNLLQSNQDVISDIFQYAEQQKQQSTGE